jgi:hypothetical protein
MDPDGGIAMSALINNFLRRASVCPTACFLKFLLLAGGIYTLHIAISHQVDVSPYLYTLLVGSVGVLATLALAFHWHCQLRNNRKKEKTIE